MSAPLNVSSDGYLTCHVSYDILNRRARAGERPPYGGHGDAHKYCEGYSCGRRKRTGESSRQGNPESRSQKITAWRQAKARENRAYLEEHVYAKTKLVG